MKKGILLPLLLFFIFAVAGLIHAQSVEFKNSFIPEKTEPSNVDIKKFDANWEKVKKGMTYDEVNALLKIKAGQVVTTGRISNPNNPAEVIRINQKEIDHTHVNDFPKYYLFFVNDKLEQWHR